MNDDPERVPGPNAGMLERNELRAEIARLKCENRRWHARAMTIIWMCVDLQDVNDGLKKENERQQELIKLFMAADLARADLDRD